MIKRGGSAVDAAAACLTAVEPTSNGIGGDAFALVWRDSALHGLNASGFAPKLADAESLRAGGNESVPIYGLVPVTVPGAPTAWAELIRRFGRLPLEEVLAPPFITLSRAFPSRPL